MFKRGIVVSMLVALWIPMIDVGMADGSRTKRYLTNKTFVSKFQCERSLQGFVNLVENIGMRVYQAKCVRK